MPNQSRIPKFLRAFSFFNYDDDDIIDQTAMIENDTATSTATNTYDSATHTNITAINTQSAATNGCDAAINTEITATKKGCDAATNTEITATYGCDAATNTDDFTATNTCDAATSVDEFTATNTCDAAASADEFTATNTCDAAASADEFTATNICDAATSAEITATNVQITAIHAQGTTATSTQDAAAADDAFKSTATTEKLFESGDYFPSSKAMDFNDSDDEQDLLTKQNTLYNLGIKRVHSDGVSDDQDLPAPKRVHFKRTNSGNDDLEVFSIKPVFNTDNVGTFINEEYPPEPVDPNAPEPTREELFFENEFSILCTPTAENEKPEITLPVEEKNPDQIGFYDDFWDEVEDDAEEDTENHTASDDFSIEEQGPVGSKRKREPSEESSDEEDNEDKKEKPNKIRKV